MKLFLKQKLMVLISLEIVSIVKFLIEDFLSKWVGNIKKSLRIGLVLGSFQENSIKIKKEIIQKVIIIKKEINNIKNIKSIKNIKNIDIKKKLKEHRLKPNKKNKKNK